MPSSGGGAKSSANYRSGMERPKQMGDDELSALSKQYRPFLPKLQGRKLEGIADEELSALSKQYRPFLKQGGAKSSAQYGPG